MTKNLISLFISLLLLCSMVSIVNAETIAEQSQELETSVVCETGSYGSLTKCESTAKGKQTQQIKVLGKTHEMANTSLDSFSLIAATGVVAIGLGVATKKFIFK